MNSNIDACVAKYIKANKDKFKVGAEAQKEFDEVKSTLNIDDAFVFEVKEFEGIPAFYMYSSKSKTLIQVYFAIKAEAGHIELSVKELTDKYKSDKEDNTMTENTIILGRAKALIESCDVEGLEDVKEALKDVTGKIDDIIDTCEGGKDKGDKKDDKVDDKTKEAVNEAIDALYQKAAMCESVEDATPYIEKAEELQKAIEDIPEENSVKDDEYPADDVTGGEGQKPTQEEIKDLVGDDKDALDLLLSDEQSVTIDA